MEEEAIPGTKVELVACSLTKIRLYFMQRVMKYATLLTFHLHAVQGVCKPPNPHPSHICIGGGCTKKGAASCISVCKIYARIAPNAAVDIDHPKIGKYLTALQFAFAILFCLQKRGERVLTEKKDQEGGNRRIQAAKPLSLSRHSHKSGH